MTSVQFTRYAVTLEIWFQNGLECCEWCSHVFVNSKRHFQCKLTGEEMVSPGDSIGWECPLRKQKEVL